VIAILNPAVTQSRQISPARKSDYSIAFVLRGRNDDARKQFFLKAKSLQLGVYNNVYLNILQNIVFRLFHQFVIFGIDE